MRVNVTRPITHVCPYRNEVDRGVLKASWRGESVELHAFNEFVSSFEELSISHEQLTSLISGYLRQKGAVEVSARTTWDTAGMDVEVVA